jgi:hypothetical protein
MPCQSDLRSENIACNFSYLKHARGWHGGCDAKLRGQSVLEGQKAEWPPEQNGE